MNGGPREKPISRVDRRLRRLGLWFGGVSLAPFGRGGRPAYFDVPHAAVARQDVRQISNRSGDLRDRLPTDTIRNGAQAVIIYGRI